MNLTYFSLPSFRVDPGKIKTIDTAVPRIYQDFCQGLQDKGEEIRVSNDDFESLRLTKSINWYGDPFLSINLNQLFQRKLQARVEQAMTQEQIVQLSDNLRQLLGTILSDSYLMDVPLELPESPDISKLIKFSGLQVDMTAQVTAYDILETLIKIQMELGDHRVIAVTNLSHYLNADQLNQLVRLVATTDLSIVIIEFSFCNRREFFSKCDYSYIDSDFVIW
ncbi:type II-A CRISPR-associated protein Csn2 [Lactobacillus sp. PFC-70]|nr:type II-A CRISPR-associated protein Csn2 [Lactobacillus sp. PFC-70]